MQFLTLQITLPGLQGKNTDHGGTTAIYYSIHNKYQEFEIKETDELFKKNEPY